MEVAGEVRREREGAMEGEESRRGRKCIRGRKVMVFVFIYVASYYILM